MRKLLVVLVVLLAPATAAVAHTDTGGGGSETITKTLHVGTSTVRWHTKLIPDQSTSELSARIGKRTVLFVGDSTCSGYALLRNLVIRADGCGNGAVPIRFSAVRLEGNPRVKIKVRLRIVVTT